MGACRRYFDSHFSVCAVASHVNFFQFLLHSIMPEGPILRCSNPYENKAFWCSYCHPFSILLRYEPNWRRTSPLEDIIISFSITASLIALSCTIPVATLSFSVVLPRFSLYPVAGCYITAAFHRGSAHYTAPLRTISYE